MIGGLLSLLIALIGVEWVLSADPLGMAYFYDSSTMNGLLVAHPAGWAFAPGDYALDGWQISVLPEHTRRVPDTNADGKTVLFVGDSVTLGWGVSDADTFVNQLARELPSHRMINAGQNGMNSDNIRRMIALYPDVPHVVYYVVWNDPERTQTPTFPDTRRGSAPPRSSWIGHYLVHLDRILIPFDFERLEAGYDYARFETDIRALAADPRVLLIADDDGRRAGQIAAAHGAHLIPPHTDPISFIDGHPNPAGHAHIAAHMLPLIRRHLARP